MNLDFDHCYRAIQSRDPRFDGHFFTAVLSTGIYCRPICPARTPKPANVRFFSGAAAAEAAGFRACRRCRPDTCPGSPDWDVRADLVARALRLIAAGTVDLEGVEGVARRLAVSARHLHRELVAEVGTGALALARTRRAQTARLLIDQTTLPLTEIAFAAGFASIRQFNETLRASFGCNPTALRRRHAPVTPGSGSLVVHLACRGPLATGPLLSYLARHAIPGVEEVDAQGYRRTVALPHSHGVIALQPVPDGHAVLLRAELDDLRDLSMLVSCCRQAGGGRWLGFCIFVLSGILSIQRMRSQAVGMRLSTGSGGIGCSSDFTGSLVLCWGCAEPFQSRCRA
jgi:AraC family transcriptional regulator of adaptative response / DNA-3-methyladenine glycosylase II